MRVLAGDIGGTKTAVAAARITGRGVFLLRTEVYPSAAWPGLEEILADFLAKTRFRAERAAFGVAGPVVSGRARITKLPWTVDEKRLARRLSLRRVRVANDFAAAALAIPLLPARSFATVVPGREDPHGPVAVLGAGTGLGQAVLIRAGKHPVVLDSEGGHADFGPRDEREDRLVRYLRGRHGRVSRDRVLSGPGLVDIYEFLRKERTRTGRSVRARPSPEGDPAAAISRLALSGTDPISREALELFATIYGSEAGNLALQYRATGGVYLAGGIAPKILPALSRPAFRRSFREKPPLESLLSRIPVRVVLEADLGLIGAAALAYRTEIATSRR